MNQSPLDIYPGFVKTLVVNQSADLEGYLHAAVGISTEAGEVLDIIKKTWAFNKPMDRLKLQHEMGDLLFYMQFMCNVMELSLDELADSNMSKLKKRYPEGYTDKAAQERLDGII